MTVIFPLATRRRRLWRTARPIILGAAKPTPARLATPITSHGSEDSVAASQMRFAGTIANAAVTVTAASSGCAARARVATLSCLAVAAAAEAHSPAAARAPTSPSKAAVFCHALAGVAVP